MDRNDPPRLDKTEIVSSLLALLMGGFILLSSAGVIPNRGANDAPIVTIVGKFQSPRTRRGSPGA